MQLAAESLGLGSCWIQIRNRSHDDTLTAEDYIVETLQIPKGQKVEAIIAAGYPDEEKPPHKKESLPFQKLHLNSWGKRH